MKIVHTTRFTRHLLAAVLAASAALVAAFPAHGQELQRPGKPYFTDAGARVEPSMRMTYEGAPWEYEIRVALPPAYSADRSYPVLWVLDGSFVFDEAVQTAFSMASTQIIVVGVGAPRSTETPDSVEIPDLVGRRNYEFLVPSQQPCHDLGAPGSLLERECHREQERFRRWRERKTVPRDGAARFLRFLTTDVRHRISEAYPTTGENVLYGYSYGGNFCLYALLSDPGAFQKYICASPSLVYGGDALLAQEERWARAHSDLAAQVFLSAGEAEIINGPVGVVSGTVRMAEVLSLRRYPSLRLHVRIIPEASHDGTGRVFALTQGFRALLPAAPPAVYRAPAVD